MYYKHTVKAKISDKRIANNFWTTTFTPNFTWGMQQNQAIEFSHPIILKSRYNGDL